MILTVRKEWGTGESLVYIVHLYNSDIGVEFGMKKVLILIMRMGMIARTDGSELLIRQVMNDIEGGGYINLGIL